MTTLDYLRSTLRIWVEEQHGGNKMRAAAQLGMMRPTLRKLLSDEPHPPLQQRTLDKIIKTLGPLPPEIAKEHTRPRGQRLYDTGRIPIPDGSTWSEAATETRWRLPRKAQEALEEFQEWGVRHGVDAAARNRAVRDIILWPLRGGSYLIERYWQERSFTDSELIRIVRHGVGTAKVLLAPSAGRRYGKRRRRPAGLDLELPVRGLPSRRDPKRRTAINQYKRDAIGLQRRDRVREAVDWWVEVLKLDPNDLDAHNMLAAAYFRLGAYAAAWEHMRAMQRLGGAPMQSRLKDMREKQSEPEPS